MTQYSHHPEVQIGHELREAIARVANGIEHVIVVTSTAGEPLAAIVPLATLRVLDELDTTEEGTREEEDDRSSIRLR